MGNPQWGHGFYTGVEKGFENGCRVGATGSAYELAERMRVLIDALANAERENRSPDNWILMKIMREAIAPFLPVDEKQEEKP